MPQGNGGKISADPLGSAITHLTGNARTTGEEPFHIRSSAAIVQRRVLLEWASVNLAAVKPSFWEGRTVIGGSEHDIWEHEDEIWKITRPDHFGWTVLPGGNGVPTVAEATPLEYLNRWEYSNRFLGDCVKLRGVYAGEQGVQMIISQKFIAGTYPAKREIADELLDHGFFPLRDFSIGAEGESSFFSPAEKIALFDEVPDNFIKSQGLPVPIDLVIVFAGLKLRDQLLHLLL